MQGSRWGSYLYWGWLIIRNTVPYVTGRSWKHSKCLDDKGLEYLHTVKPFKISVDMIQCEVKTSEPNVSHVPASPSGPRVHVWQELRQEVSVTAPNHKQLKCPLTMWTNCGIFTHGVLHSYKKKKTMTACNNMMNLIRIIWNGKSKAQKNTCTMVLCI